MAASSQKVISTNLTDATQTLINGWKKHALEGMVSVFSGRTEAAELDREEELEKLHAKIGQLVVERDFLRKASGR
jgi:transposase